MWWRRRIKETHERVDELAAETEQHSRSFHERQNRVKKATLRVELAAAALMASHDEYLREVARVRRG